MLLTALLILLVGIVLLVGSTRIFVTVSEKFSVAVRISPLVIGTTIVAIGTSLPELSVSVTASIANDAGLAFGNIIGSNITNVFLVFAIGILIGKLRIGTEKTQRSAGVLAGATILFTILYLFVTPSWIAGVILLILALVVSAQEYWWGMVGRAKEDAAQHGQAPRVRFSLALIAQSIGSIIGVVLGGMLTVFAIERIAIATGYSTTMLGFTIAAIGTSLPEILATIFSEKDHQEKVALGDILGSNLYNVLLIGGICLLLIPSTKISVVNWLWFILATGMLVVILRWYRGTVVPKKVGVFFLGLFVLYVATQTMPQAFYIFKQTVIPAPAPTMVSVPPSTPSPTGEPSATPTPTPLTFDQMNELYGPCTNVPVLMYHHIQTAELAKAEGYINFTVYPDSFQKQLEYLSARGYQTIVPADIIAFFDSGMPIAKKSVLLTFDDAYDDFASQAIPLLRQFGFKATVFVPAGLIDNPGYLSWSTIAGSGSDFYFANHTWSHHSSAGTLETIKKEITVADTLLVNHHVNANKVFAYPYGGASQNALNVLRDLDYQLAFTTTPGRILCKKQRLTLPRVRIGNGSLSAYGL